MHGSVILGNEHNTILRSAIFFTEIRNVLRVKVNADSVNPNDPSQLTKLLDKVMNFPNSISFSFLSLFYCCHWESVVSFVWIVQIKNEVKKNGNFSVQWRTQPNGQVFQEKKLF